MPDYTGPVPVPTPETRPYWEAAKRHELVLPRCRQCKTMHFYPRGICPDCMSSDIAWEQVSGKGTVHTFTVVHRGLKDFPLGSPYVIAMVELDEGPRLMTNLVDVEPDATKITIGMRVEVTFADVTPTATLLHFKPVGGAA